MIKWEGKEGIKGLGDARDRGDRESNKTKGLSLND